VLDRKKIGKGGGAGTGNDVMARYGQILIGVIWSLQLNLKAQASKLGQGDGANARTEARPIGKDGRGEFVNLAVDQVARDNLDGKDRINTKAVV